MPELRDSVARLRLAEQRAERLEDKLFYAERSRLAALARARKSLDEARFLHGLLLRNGIDPEEARLP